MVTTNEWISDFIKFVASAIVVVFIFTVDLYFTY